MKSFILLAGLAAIACAQTAKVSPDTVVATMNGKPMTAAEFEQMIAIMPEDARTKGVQDPEKYFAQVAHFRKILELAEKEHFAERSPIREKLVEMRRQWIVNARIDQEKDALVITPESQRAWYEAHSGDYKATKAQFLAIGFSQPGLPNQPRVARTEAQARTIALGLVQQARAGADFKKLVSEYSEDPSTRDKGGEYGLPIRPTSLEVPSVLRKPVLALKQGEVSDPIRVESGYYIVKAVYVGPLPYEDVKDDVYQAMKDAAVKSFLDETRKESSFKVENPEYFKSAASK